MAYSNYSDIRLLYHSTFKPQIHVQRISMMQWFHKHIAGEITSTIKFATRSNLFLLCNNKSTCNQSNTTSVHFFKKYIRMRNVHNGSFTIKDADDEKGMQGWIRSIHQIGA